MLQMCGVFAEFERSMIVDRVNAGLARARARAQGKRLGRHAIELRIGVSTLGLRTENPLDFLRSRAAETLLFRACCVLYRKHLISVRRAPISSVQT
jgi:DNA invertase Pin-like site-specific DNA recombinase